jgi:hypothetical protein
MNRQLLETRSAARLLDVGLHPDAAPVLGSGLSQADYFGGSTVSVPSFTSVISNVISIVNGLSDESVPTSSKLTLTG